MKKFLSAALVLCLIVVGVVFAGCGPKEIVLQGGPAYEDQIYGNGGFVVTKGDYVYFTDAYVSSSSLGSSITNEQGTVTETGLYRAEMDTELVSDVETPVLKNVQLMVSKVVGFENMGLYIFKDKIYFPSPTTESDSSGVRYDLLTFYRCNLDGSNLEVFYQTESFSDGKFSMTMIDEQVYLLIYDGNQIIIVDENGGENVVASNVTGAVLPSRTTIVSNSENPSSIECSVYYTVDKESQGSISMGNILYRADIVSKNVTELLNEDRVAVTLSSLEGGRLFYTRNELFANGTISDYNIYSNSLDGSNFHASEIKHFDDETISVVPLGIYEGKNLGVAYVSGDGKIIIKNLDNSAGNALVSSSVTKIICSRNGYLYYVSSSSIYRISLTDADATSEKISGTLTIKSDYFDIDEDFFYFFAEDSSKTNKISCYRVDLDSSDKIPVKMA